MKRASGTPLTSSTEGYVVCKSCLISAGEEREGETWFTFPAYFFLGLLNISFPHCKHQVGLVCWCVCSFPPRFYCSVTHQMIISLLLKLCIAQEVFWKKKQKTINRDRWSDSLSRVSNERNGGRQRGNKTVLEKGCRELALVFLTFPMGRRYGTGVLGIRGVSTRPMADPLITEKSFKSWLFQEAFPIWERERKGWIFIECLCARHNPGYLPDSHNQP